MGRLQEYSNQGAHYELTNIFLFFEIYNVNYKGRDSVQGVKSLGGHIACLLGVAKQYLWGLGAESWCIVASLAFAKMIPQWDDHFGRSKACYDAL